MQVAAYLNAGNSFREVYHGSLNILCSLFAKLSKSYTFAPVNMHCSTYIMSEMTKATDGNRVSVCAASCVSINKLSKKSLDTKKRLAIAGANYDTGL
jgi:hypothetical protein